jgi:NitT/TauT family transport system substrate-binding protein
MPIIESRRHFLTQLGTAGVAGLGGLGVAPVGSLAAEPPPEVTTIRLAKYPATCAAPYYVFGELLRVEGFTDIRYEIGGQNPALGVARNQADWDTDFAANIIAEIDTGAPLTMTSGMHVGCFELYTHGHVRSIAGLKGRTVGWQPDYSASKHLVVLMAKNVGLDPDKDVHWVADPTTNPIDLFLDRKIDAFLAVPPDTYELRARGIGHSLVSSTTDHPWSNYFCCMLFSRTEFVQKYPIATKRVVRAFLKATDLCANEPERVSRMMVELGFTDRYDYALQTLQELPYSVWRNFDPEDTVRFFSLRLHEAGYLKSTPRRIIAEHTNWRFVNEVKRELKA